ncbi:nucleotidyl transferase AbiEii/AbiGii toxin family protein [Zobellia uliginosa]|uniref:nucleotidyl transferase AbiEii/AbiGii toxin family protein n=1 Tax=Zobellia uliginosa TaxID=143224 RepID=UPI001C07A46C|nr:nucleotidyl transferase AbiEii/AbiGii toxin family protein [Zobellia uliginosa]MBU2946598.1 nucleotidyl transferase AbiEii/AbiGii toxin family protein [Zobellia uliginosa]
MSAVSKELLTTIQELLSLPSLSKFALGGGTNLAYRYNHRKSIDIDLFSNEIIGKEGYSNVEKEICDFYGDSLMQLNYPCEENNQYIFLRCFIIKGKETIKVEILQNMKTMYDIEIVDDIRFISKKDIGLFKLVSASSRSAKKDIYDLDYITEEIDIIILYEELREKQSKFNKEEDKSIFDLDGDTSPIDNPSLLLSFDNTNNKLKSSRPIHSDNTIDIVKDSKGWALARIEWRTKMRKLYKHLEIDFPGPKSISVK